MRRSVFLLGPVVAAALLFACEDTPAEEVPVDRPDATSFEGGPQVEGGTLPEGSADAADAADAALPKTVTVNVLRAGAPAANVLVVFHDATGAVLETKTTASNGKASSTAGSTPVMASALLGGGTLRRILTWTAVQLGDELFATDIGLPASQGTVNVTLQGTFADGGAASANASIGACTGFALGTTVLIDLTPECARPSSSILARALNDGSDKVLAYAFAKAKAGPVDAGTASATVGPWATPGKVTITPANCPLNTNPSASFSEISDGLAFPNDYFSGFDRITGKATFDVAPAFADAYQAVIRFVPPLSSSSTLLVGKRVAVAANIDLDLGAVLPALDSATLDPVDARRPKLDWTTVGNASLAMTDGGSIAIQWADARVDDYGWTFIVPPDATSVKAPAMPAAADAWLPRAAGDAGPASNFFPPEVTFIETDLLASYAELRRDVGRLIPSSYSQDRASRAVLPAAGTLKATSFRLVPE